VDVVELKLSLEGIDSPEVALVELQQWLQQAGIRVELERLPPTEEELGGKAVAVILICSLLNESISEALHEVDVWQQHHSKAQAVLHLTGQPQPDEPIREQIQHGNLHIHLREPEPPLKEIKQPVIAPPPKPPLKKG